MRVHLITYQWASCVALFWSLVRIYQIPVSQNKALKTPFQYVLYLSRPKDIFPQRGLNTAKLLFCAAKVLHFFDICKREVDFFRFFGMIDTRQAQKNGPKSVFYSVYKGTKMAIEQLREKPCKEAVLIHYLFVRHCSLQV